MYLVEHTRVKCWEQNRARHRCRDRVYFITTSPCLSFSGSCRWRDSFHNPALSIGDVSFSNFQGFFATMVDVHDDPVRRIWTDWTWGSPPISYTLRSRTKRTIANGGKLHAPRRLIGHYSGLDENSARSDPSAAASSSYIVRTEPFPAHSRDRYACPCPTISRKRAYSFWHLHHDWSFLIQWRKTDGLVESLPFFSSECTWDRGVKKKGERERTGTEVKWKGEGKNEEERKEGQNKR